MQKQVSSLIPSLDMLDRVLANQETGYVHFKLTVYSGIIACRHAGAR